MNVSLRVFLFLAVTGWEARAQETPQLGVTIRVVIDSGNVAHVHEQYRLTADTGAIQLQHLQRSCARVGAVTLSTSAGTTVLEPTSKGPWATLRDSATIRSFSRDLSVFEVSYTVDLEGTKTDIPLVHVTRPIPRLEGERQGGVLLTVATDAVIGFPRLSRSGNEWAGRFVAIPSFVSVEQPPGVTSAGPCTDANLDAPDGGLTWRFWTLLGIMIAWVPLYLAWARRAQVGGDS